jgi:hypothetical protein
MSREFRLSTGGLVLALSCDSDDCEFNIDEASAAFVTDEEPDVVLRVHRCATLEEPPGERVFDSGGVWQLFRDRRNWTIRLATPRPTAEPYQLVVLEPDLRSGDIYMRPPNAGGGLLPFPLRYPSAQVLAINLLAASRGALLHACGIRDRDRGLMFVGSSGAGKSTMVKLWKDREGVAILSDDRIIVRELDDGFWAYGTPWHGEVNLCSPERVRLDCVFVLRHGEENRAVPLNGPQVVSSLLARSFPTFWSTEGMTLTLDILGRLSQEVRCYDLAFLPDGSIIELVRNTCDA